MHLKNMTDQEQKEHIKEYSDRNRFWANQALNQLGYSINLFTTLGIAFLTFLFKIRGNYGEIKIDSNLPIDWTITFYVISIITSLTTVVLGLVSVTSRLYDIRITRHLIWTRKRAMKKSKWFLPEGFIDLSKSSKIGNYFKTLTKKIKWIETEHFDDKESLKEKFNDLRKQSKLLGELAWRSHKLQLLTIFFAVVFYGLS
ncbi:hypothetical protein C900_01444 [Fulvivirga imtechensis AK7]|uniref:Uncharacterized protein n=2 Tax=Fulvivirga TaxID=396811 RepID=L8K1N3_9BACT|nr:hypothetical protein C900_01444 [Fulvivirga imtechensis AK7]